MRGEDPLDLHHVPAGGPAPARLHHYGLATDDELRPQDITNSPFRFCSDLTPSVQLRAGPGAKMRTISDAV